MEMGRDLGVSEGSALLRVRCRNHVLWNSCSLSSGDGDYGSLEPLPSSMSHRNEKSCILLPSTVKKYRDHATQEFYFVS